VGEQEPAATRHIYRADDGLDPVIQRAPRLPIPSEDEDQQLLELFVAEPTPQGVGGVDIRAQAAAIDPTHQQAELLDEGAVQALPANDSTPLTRMAEHIGEACPEGTERMHAFVEGSHHPTPWPAPCRLVSTV
jgi:hypothetical protein